MEKNKVKLTDVIVYSNENCPYCKNIKNQFEENEVCFEERDTTEHAEEWIDVHRLTGIPSVPTIKYKNEYFVPGRDFNNPMGLIQILSAFKPSTFDKQTHILEKLTTLNYHFSQAMNHLSQQVRTMDDKLTELHNKLIEKPKTEEDVDKSTD